MLVILHALGQGPSELFGVCRQDDVTNFDQVNVDVETATTSSTTTQLFDISIDYDLVSDTETESMEKTEATKRQQMESAVDGTATETE